MRLRHRSMKIVPTWCQPGDLRLRISFQVRDGRELECVTPSGIESGPSVTKQREDSSSPTENRGTRSAKRRVVTLSGSKVAQ
jgi:hypothetical protein